MNSIVFPIRFFISLGLLLSLHAVGYASPSPVDSTRFCHPLQLEEGERVRKAAKPVTDLSVGEPRTVRMIYFAPNDRPFRVEVDERMKRIIRRVQAFYSQQMQAHGNEDMTFRFETDADGQPIVHRLQGLHPDNHYLNDPHSTVFGEIEQVYDTFANIYVAYMTSVAL